MPTEVKQRKKTQQQAPKLGGEPPETLPANGKNEPHKAKTEDGETEGTNKRSAGPDVKTLLCFLSLAACGALSWVVLQQNERFSLIEEKYKSLHGKTSGLLDMEEKIVTVSRKLAASEDDVQAALSSVSLATRLQQDISALHATIMAMQDDDDSASRDLQTVNARFLNVTETWQERLAAVTSDLAALKAEARESHAGAMEQVNEAERRAGSLAERLEELEDSTRRNARALERTEVDDTKRVQEQLDWNTKQIHKLEEQLRGLTKRESELSSQLQEHVPRAQACEEHLPQVEAAVRSILKLSGDLSGAEKRLEELTLQVFGTEDSMLKALNEILDIRQELDTLHAQNSILRMKDELSVVKEAVHELTSILRENRAESQVDSWDEEGWTDGVEEPWPEDELTELTGPPQDELEE